MQLLGAPERLQESSIYLHTIYQLSSPDGLILRHRFPAVHLPVPVMSHCCRELNKAPFHSIKSFPRQVRRGGAFHHSRPLRSEEASCLSANSIRKQDQIAGQDRQSKNVAVFLYPSSLVSCCLSQWEHLRKQTGVPWGLRACLDILNTLLGRNKGVGGPEWLWDLEKDLRCQRPQMFISRSLVGNGAPHYWPPWGGHLLIIVWDPVGPKANYRSHLCFWWTNTSITGKNPKNPLPEPRSQRDYLTNLNIYGGWTLLCLNRPFFMLYTYW